MGANGSFRAINFGRKRQDLAVQREGRVFVRKSTNYGDGRAKPTALQYYQS
jgi:hypothetical protein